jgi:tRNA (guanine10-N2)-methyltransferase
MMKKYVVHFTQMHETFRLAELEALATLNEVDVEIEQTSLEHPFTIVRCKSNEEAVRLVPRSLLVK